MNREIGNCNYELKIFPKFFQNFSSSPSSKNQGIVLNVESRNKSNKTTLCNFSSISSRLTLRYEITIEEWKIQ